MKNEHKDVILGAKFGKQRKARINVLDWLMFLLTGKGKIGIAAVDEGLVDYSGQGRDEYGK